MHSEDTHHDYRRQMGRRLRSLRERLGETQVQFAKRLNVMWLSVHKYETGVTCPTSETLQNLEASGIDSSYVAFGYPSLATPEARKNFVSAQAWVKRECQIASLEVSEQELFDAAWYMFCKVSEAPIAEEETMVDMAKLALMKVSPP